MPAVSELDLPLLAVEHPDLSVDPMPYVEAARRRHPWLARSNVGGYIVHGYHAVKDLSGRDESLRPDFDGIVDFYGVDRDAPWARFMREIMVAAHGPVHARLRASVADAFTPRHANRYRELMRQVISELLDRWVPLGRFDFTEFASHFPITVFCALMGISTEPIPGLRETFEIQSASYNLDRTLLPQVLDGYERLWAFTDGMVLDREAQGSVGDGLLDAMIAAKDAGRLDETELRHMLLLLVLAGYDTSKNMLAVTVHELLKHPVLWARCAADRAYCGRVIEEILRHSGVSSIYRVATEDISYDGVTFPAGTLLVFLMGLASRDPSVFPDPLTFDPDRGSQERHMAFGRGAHMCIGQHLARVQLEEGLHVITQRLASPRLAGEVVWRPYLGIWGIKSLPIAFDPA
jgi:cytochrome P450